MTAVPATDWDMYRAIVAHVAAGQGYYAAAAAEHMARHYPMSPAEVFREPLMTRVLVALHWDFMRRAVLIGIWAAGLSTMVVGPLKELGMGLGRRVGATALLFIPSAGVLMPNAPYMHENWAAVLILLAFALYRDDRYLPSVVLGLLACLFRELAAPFLLVMLAGALIERDYRQALLWSFAIQIFAVCYIWHLLEGNAVSVPDRPSPGWLAFGGPSFVFAAIQRGGLLCLLPAWLGGLLVAGGVWGLANSRDPLLLRIAAYVGFYLIALLFVGRPDNAYWGLLFAPFGLLGLALLPLSLRARATLAKHL